MKPSMKPSRFNLIYPYQFNKDYFIVFNTWKDTIGIVSAREAEFIRSCQQNAGIHYTRIEEFTRKGFVLESNVEEPEETVIVPTEAYSLNLVINRLKPEQQVSLTGENILHINDLLTKKLGDKLDDFLEKASSIYRVDTLVTFGEKHGITLSEDDAASLIVLMQPTALAV